MSETSIAKKMKRKPDARAAILNAPAGYEAASFPGMEAAATSLDGLFDWIQIFVQNRDELDRLAPEVVQALKPDSILWISFPKGGSKVQTDLTRDEGWDALQALDLKWITLISVNEIWSAFGLRPYKPGEPRQAAR
jgi:hypothetical protein